MAKLREMLRGYEIRHGIRTELEMPAEIEKHAWAVTSVSAVAHHPGSCTNAVKHARASKIRVASSFQTRVVEVLVKDDAPASARRRRGAVAEACTWDSASCANGLRASRRPLHPIRLRGKAPR